MWWMHDGAPGGWWWMVAMGWVWMLLFWGGLIALIIWAVRRFSARDSGRPTPLDIAREHYARGEITREQFEELRRDLSQ